GLKIGTIADLIQYRSEHESMIERLGARVMETPWGPFESVAYRDLASGALHLALVHGTVSPDVETLVRVHEPATLLDVLFCQDTNHSWSIGATIEAIKAAPSGVLVLLNCQGSAEQLLDKVQAWNQPDPKSVVQGKRCTVRGGHA